MSALSHLMHTYARQPVAFVRGLGTRLWDVEGNGYFDAVSGVAVTNLGHSHPAITAAIAEQAGLLMHTSNMFAITWQERLGEKLNRLSGMERGFFCNSGAEANETALKLARLHAQRKGVSDPKVLVMENSFHGRTLATLAATGNPAVHKGFEPLVPGFFRLPYDDIDAVRDVAVREPGVVAVLVEPVQGEGGVRIASPEYLRELRQICDEHDWLLMVDEVQTGMGRTGAWFGYQHAQILPDVVTLAKGLGNGYPIGACLARGYAAELFSPGSHGSTFGGNPLACRVATTVIDVMERGNVPQHAAEMGRHLLQELRVELKDVPSVTSVRGHGLMIGIELDAPCKDLVHKALQQERLLISVTREKTIRLLPALIVTRDEIDELVFKIKRLLLANNEVAGNSSL